MKRRVLFFSVDLIPLPGRPVNGGGLRAWGLAEGLRAHGHEVLHSVPRRLLEGLEDPPKELAGLAFDTSRIAEVVRKVDPDVVLFEQWGLLDHYDGDGVPVVLDLHGSLILENAYRGQVNWSLNAVAKLHALRKADLVVVPGHRQADYFKAWLMLAGDSPRDLPLVTVPVSMPPEQPSRKRGRGKAKKRKAGPRFVYGGNLWPWIDPFPGLGFLVEEMEARKKGHLDLYVSLPQRQDVVPQEPPLPDSAGDVMAPILASRRVTSHDRISRDEMIAAYLGSDVAVDLYRRNHEREIAVTTRTVEYLWCGLPVVYADYQELSSKIREADAGWVLDPEDEWAIREAFAEILEEPEVVRRKGRHAQKLVAEQLTWDRTIEPLARFVADPVRKGKGRSVLGQVEADMTSQKEVWEKEKARLHAIIEGKNEDIARVTADVSARDRDIRWRDDEMRLAQSRLADAEKARKKALDAKDRQIVRLEKKLDSLGEELKTRSREAASEVKQRDREMREREAMFQKELSRREARVDEARKEAKKEHERLSRALQKLEREKDKLQEKLERQAEEAAQQVQSRDEELRRREALYQEELNRREARLQEARKDARTELANRDKVAARLEEAKEKLQEKLENQASEFTRQVQIRDEELRRKDALHQEEIARRDARVDEVRAESKAELARRERAVERLEKKVADLEDRLEEHARDAARQIQARNEELRALGLRREEEIARRDARIEALQDEMRALELRVQKREEEAREQVEAAVAAKEAVAEELTRCLQAAEEQFRQDQAATVAELEKVEVERARVAAALEARHADVAHLNEELGRQAARIAEQDQVIGVLPAELEGHKARILELENALVGRDHRIEWLEGVIASMKNRLPFRVYKFGTYWGRRLVIQIPMLAGLYVLNVMSNLYMQWWTARHRQRIFPGM